MTKASKTNSPDATAKTASFGFREVGRDEKPQLVQGVFRSVAGNYDLMNDLMSGGVHRLWKNEMVEWLAPKPGKSYLDVAGGTGDIAFRIWDRVEGQAQITVLDLTEDMLRVGRDRALDSGRISSGEGSLTWVSGDAMGPEAWRALPLPGIQPRGAAPARRALRSLFLQGSADAGSGRRP